MSKRNGVAKSGDCRRFSAACSEVLRISESVSSASETSKEISIGSVNDSVFDKTERSPSKPEVRRVLVFSSSLSTESRASNVVSVSSENEDICKEQDMGGNEYRKELFPGEIVDYMIALTEASEKDAQAKKHATMNFLYEGSAEFSSLKSLGLNQEHTNLVHRLEKSYPKDFWDEKLRSIENLNTHLIKIIEEVDLLKAKLQNPVLHNALHIKMCYHRFILEFFQFATTMINGLESNKADMEWIHCKNFDCFRMEPLLTNLCDGLIEKQKALDSLEEFCSSLEKLYDLSKYTPFRIDSCSDTNH